MAIGQYCGLAGMVIGGIIGTIYGGQTAAGMAIGGAIGGMVGAYFFPEGPKMKNVPPPEPGEGKVQISSYGAMIPKVWGSKRFAGNIFEMSEIKETRTVSKHRMNGTRYYEKGRFFTATMAIVFCEGPIDSILRIWVNNEVFVDFRDENDPYYPPVDGAITAANQSASEDLKNIYYTAHYGTPDQMPDASLEAYLGVGNVPGYRDLFYIVFKDFPLGRFGAVPALEVEVVKTTQTGTTDEAVSVILNDICNAASIDSSAIDVSDLTSDMIQGYAITRQMPARAAIDPLISSFMFDSAEIDWKLHFVKRGEPSVVSIGSEDLAARADSSQSIDMLIQTKTQAAELPTHLVFNYESRTKDYEIASQHAIRIDKNRFSLMTVSVGVVLSDERAKQIAEVLLNALWIARNKYSFVTTKKYLYLSPAKVITVGGKDMRIVSMVDKTGLIEFVCDSEDAGSYSSTAAVDTLSRTPVDLLRASKIPNVFFAELPVIDSDEDYPGFYAIFYGIPTLFSGGGLRITYDGGISWATVAYASPASASVGDISGTLPDGPTGILDYTTYIDVDFSPSLVVPTSQIIEDGLNIAAIGSDNNGWEIIQFETVTPVSGSVYRLTGIIRGLYGTEANTSEHGSGEYFILLSGRQSIDRVELSLENLNTAFMYQPVSSSLYGAEPTEQFTCVGHSSEQMAPTGIEFGRTSTSIVISWKRNDCNFFTVNEFDSVDDIPLTDGPESYEIDIKNASDTVLRTLTSATNSVTYTNAATDFPSGIVGQLKVSVHQISTTMGRGLPGNKSY
jgi:hypothetical protein